MKRLIKSNIDESRLVRPVFIKNLPKMASNEIINKVKNWIKENCPEIESVSYDGYGLKLKYKDSAFITIKDFREEFDPNYTGSSESGPSKEYTPYVRKNGTSEIHWKSDFFDSVYADDLYYYLIENKEIADFEVDGDIIYFY